MKSQHNEHTIKTNCKDCAFAIYEDKSQISCKFNRIEKFGKDVIEAYDNDNEFYVIDRLCTYYRNKAWGYTQADTDKVLKESAIGFDIIFNCSNINAEQTQIITHFINNHNYYPSKINIILIHDYNSYSAVKEFVSKIARNISTHVGITICEDITSQVHQILLKTKNAYHALIQYPELLEINSLSRINSFINDDLNKLVIANVNGVEFIGNFIYQLFYTMNNNKNYQDNINNIIKDSKEKNMYIEI